MTIEDEMALNKVGYDYLEACFSLHAKKPFLTVADSGEEITYGKFWQRAESYAARLAELGVQPHDRLLIRMENSVHFLLLYFAGAIGGFTVCPVDPALPESRFENIKEQLKPRYVCIESNLSEWTTAPAAPIHTPLQRRSEDDFLIILSSGTTGKAKGIVHTLTSIVESARSFAGLAEHGEQTVVYHHFPMFYMAGVFNMFFCPAVSGSRIVLAPRFSRQQMLKFWAAPRQYGVNHLTLTPTMALSLTQLYRKDDDLLDHLSKYEGVISTSSMLYDSVAVRFYETFEVPLMACYGVTEVGGSITLQSWEDAIAHESVGRFRPEVSILAGEAPESPAAVRIKTPFMMRGYLSEGEIVSGVDADGYFTAGDLGYLKNGLLYITGRENDIVKKGGEFIPLTMIENIVLTCPGVLDAAVVAVPDDYWGNRVILFYVPEPENELEDIERTLSERFNQNLRMIERPDKLIPVPRMPKTSIGKTIKRDLVKRYTI